MCKTRESLEKGQSLVEMAFGLVILLLIVSGVVDIARAYFLYVGLEDAAGEAAVFMAINPACRTSTDGTECADPNNAEYRAHHAGSSEIDWAKAVITLDRPMPYGAGETVTATVEYRFGLFTPIISQIAGDNGITLTAKASQIIITE